MHLYVVCLFVSNGNDLRDILKPFMADIEKDTFRIVVHRRRIMRSALTAVKHTGFSFKKAVVVDFSGEDAQDEGGPRREFFRYCY